MNCALFDLITSIKKKSSLIISILLIISKNILKTVVTFLNLFDYRLQYNNII